MSYSTAQALQRLAATRLVRVLFFRGDDNIFSVLYNADFRNLWMGQMVSFVGDALAYNTLTLAIIRMAKDAGEKSGGYLSLLFVLSALPSLLLGIFAGTVVDRANRKHLMIAADLIRGVLALGFLFVHDLDHIWFFIAVNISLSTVSIFFFPARTALIPLMLSKQQLLSANALAQLTHTLAFVVGAALAGILVGAFDATAPAFIIDSLTFFVSAYFIARIRISGKIEREASPHHAITAPHTGQIMRQTQAMLSDLLVGLRYIFSDQLMRGVLISFLAMFLGLGAANVTFVPLLIDELGMKEEGLGLIRFSQTMGIILGSALIGTIAMRYKARNLIGISMVMFGITTIMVSVVDNYALMVGVLFLVGLVISPPQIVASTLIQRHVPSEKMGRASSAQGTIITVANIASMGLAGKLMDEIGARLVFFGSGSIILCAGFVSWWVLRGVRDMASEDAEEAVRHAPTASPESDEMDTPVPQAESASPAPVP